MEFEVKSGKIILTDPCYENNCECGKSVNARNGVWQVSVKEYKGSKYFKAELKNFKPENSYSQRTKYSLGVDSGQLSVFDFDSYPKDPHKDKVFYDECCNISQKSFDGGIVQNKSGYVTLTVYGDGSYPAFVYFDEHGSAYKVVVFLE